MLIHAFDLHKLKNDITLLFVTHKVDLKKYFNKVYKISNNKHLILILDIRVDEIKGAIQYWMRQSNIG